MGRTLTVAALVAGLLALGACGGSSSSSSKTTTTLNQSALATARKVCTQFDRTNAARNNDSNTGAKMSDDQADDVFLTLADQAAPAAQADPKAWGPFETAAKRFNTLINGSGTDTQIEDAITAMDKACTLARKGA